MPSKSKPALPSLACMREQNLPPSRRSTLARGVCHSGVAAFHCSMACGSFQAAQTRSSGARTVVSMVMGISQGATLTIHGVPKRSVTMPKPGDQNVAAKGIVTWPPTASASNTRWPSAMLSTPIDTHRPCGLL